MSFDKMSNWLKELFNARNKYEPHRLPAWRSDLKDTIGYGVVNHWHRLSGDDNRRGLDAMADSGWNRYKIELLGTGLDGYYDRPSDLAGKLQDLYAETHERRIVLDITMVNWNVGGGGVADNGSQSICEGRFNDDWFLGLLDIVKELGRGGEGISLCPVSEWGPSLRNDRCWQKAERWNGLVRDFWPGMKTGNKESRPRTAPAGYGVEYHPDNTRDLGPAGCLLVSDTSGILAQLCQGGDIRAPFKPDAAAEWVRRCREAGRGAVLYGFGHVAFDLPTIHAMKGVP